VRTFIAVDRASLRAGAVGSHSAAKSQFGFLLAPFGELFPAGGVVAEGLGMIAPADGVALGAMTPGAVAVFGATFSGGGAPTAPSRYWRRRVHAIGGKSFDRSDQSHDRQRDF
jgi:hypothetical protein